ncbi:MAG: metallophosphoesterase [Chloroflexi bacterium]|nr:metallophosphoesterase [Chloroflexota bacterium]MBM3175101.1 metallophosphoesterase [Chloroflexota bacterium]MBM4450850.1 metallophosphoesterase [Chloroflexota bacterium]
MKILWRALNVALCLVLAVGVVACAAPKPQPVDTELLGKEAATYPEVSFIVFSDPHIYDTSLGTEGKAFEDYIANDRKLLRESGEILESAMEMIKAEKASFVLVPGDLTKDGERVSHELCAKYLSQLESAGKQVYVVPGNHDVLNGHSFKYVGDNKERVPNVKPEEFAQIYAEFGYKKALFRDPASLSYVAEPQKGLWLLALDACRYAENVEGEESITDGKFNPQTLQWIEEMLKKAAMEDKAVIAMMHHGIMEHYPSQEKNYGAYIVDDFPVVSKLLATYNARLVFTGHYHAQDITVERFPETGKFVFDIETGSLVTYPCPYRVVSIDAAQKAAIRTERVTKIKSHPTDFPQYGQAYLEGGIAGIASRTIQKYGIEAAEADVLAKHVAKAFVAHYSGDEKLPAGQIALSAEGMSGRAKLVVNNRKDLVEGLWADLEPQDNNVTLDLKTGQWQ